LNKAPWFKKTLLATAVMNVVGFVSFLPQFPAARMMSGLPESGHPLYAWIVAVWILLFGIAYGRLAFIDTSERLFVQVGAIGKLSFFLLVLACTLHGDLPAWAPLSGVPDLIFAGLFFVWLSQTRDK
jgi:hypothetical protein